ncbi:hypothetical protein P691DRAFT_685296 [Macrolepiota fuliginosa MF-IS2]|uniref:Uncharacterized protein n=1 Tax=Macrolepiota fuliginosa MF-IS2 TaxID=1400762 RepID=A0A9P5X197_9AGAR|nr:hypothetical protein P691DRAFT_685296 [Macrolepiota fuliginosa MF-IS2]
MSNTGQLRLTEDVDLISATTINGLLYGIALSLFFLCVQSLYPQLKAPHLQRQAIFILGYTSAVMICGFVYLALFTQITQLAYIDHNTSPGELHGYEQLLYGQPIGVVLSVFNTMVDALTLGTQLWCLWVVYHATQYEIIIMVLPVLLYLVGVDLQLLLLQYPNLVSQIYSFLGSQVFIGVMNIAFQLAFTLLVTLLVIGRLLLIHRHHIKLMGATNISKLYMSIVTMFIESYALESAWVLASLISYIMGGIASLDFFSNCNVAIEMIAYFLVIYRVSTGRAQSKDARQQVTRSLEFNYSTGYTTQTSVLGTAT